MGAISSLHLILLCSSCSTASASGPLVSVNIVDAFWTVQSTGSNARTLAAAQSSCHALGFTAVRFGATSFWPAQMIEWVQAPQMFWSKMDSAVEALISGGCTGLIPDLFWNIFAIPDMVGEPLGALAQGARGLNATSSWVATMQYIDDFVGRYANNSNIIAWETANEFNLLCDLDQSTMCNVCNPSSGTPATRTRADNVSTADMIIITQAWRDRILARDPQKRPISSGHAIPRTGAEHLRASYYAPSRDWTPDTLEQFSTNLYDINIAADWASVHIYPGADNARWNKTTADDPSTILYAQAAIANANAARGSSKLLYLGEFGAVPSGTLAAPRPFVDGMLALLAATGAGADPDKVPAPGVAGITVLGTAWVWEYWGDQNSTYCLWPGITAGVNDALVAYNKGR